MNKFESNPVLRRVAEVSSILALSTLAFTACSGKPHSEIREGLSPVERIDFEFGGGRQYDNGFSPPESGGSCLWGTPYDPITNNGRQSSNSEPVIDTEGNLVVSLVPPQDYLNDAKSPITLTEKRPISLTGFENFDSQLQPADDYSRDMMSIYGCIEK